MVLGALCADHHLDVGLSPTPKRTNKSREPYFCRLQAGRHRRKVRVFAGKAKAIQMDLTDCPDLFPPLATLAAFAKGASTLKGIHP